MHVSLTPRQEARIERLAAARGVDCATIVQEMIEKAVDYEEWFLEQVDKGLANARSGDLLEHSDIVRSIEERISGG